MHCRIENLFEVVEESRIQGFVSGSLDDTFIALIPKSGKPKSFNDFKPISLCNLMYKIITKVISNIIKTKIAEIMSKEQFVFFFG